MQSVVGLTNALARAFGFNGATLFAHVGGDIGDSTSWRAGASWLSQQAENRAGAPVDESGATAFDSFTGDSETWVVDGVLKWKPSPARGLKVQAEYMRRSEDGTYIFDPAGLAALTNYRNTQSGWYLQGVYQFAPRWRVGARYDSLDSGNALYTAAAIDPPLEFGAPLPALHPERVSLMLDWSPSNSRACVPSTTGTRRAMTARRITSCACNTFTDSARTARTSTRKSS